MVTMKYFKLIFGFGLVAVLFSAAGAYDFQQGMHGMKWGSSASENASLSKVHETSRVAYYANPNSLYQVSSQPIPGVFYGFYDDKFFAVFVKLRSPDQFSKLKQSFDKEFGAAKSFFDTESKQKVYRWVDGDVKIKLKMMEERGQFKMAFYYAPLSNKLNEERLENIPPDVYDKPASQDRGSVKAAPLLGK